MERTIEADKRTANEVQHSRRIVWKLPRGPHTGTPVSAARPVGCHHHTQDTTSSPKSGRLFPFVPLYRYAQRSARARTHTHTNHSPTRTGPWTLNAVGLSCRLVAESRGTSLALAPPPRACGEVYLTLPCLGPALPLRRLPHDDRLAVRQPVGTLEAENGSLSPNARGRIQLLSAAFTAVFAVPVAACMHAVLRVRGTRPDSRPNVGVLTLVGG